MSRIFLQHLGADYRGPIQEGLAWIGLGQRVRSGDSVFVKPNLTFPTFREGVMTNPQCVEALVLALKDYTGRITVCEADSGGYNRFSIDEVFDQTGIRQLQDRYGIRVVNLSHLPSRLHRFQYKGRTLAVPLPVCLLDECHLLVTAPVPKIHMNAGVSLSVKNQWGCITEPSERLRLHPFFEKVVQEVNQCVRASVAVVDGQFGLNRSGPMSGDPVRLDWLMVSDNIYAADAACCRLMQIDLKNISYLRYLKDVEGVVPPFESLEFSQDYRPFVKDRFYLRRLWTDYPGALAFRSGFVSYLAYFSPLAGFLHKLLYLFREPFYDYEAARKSTRSGCEPQRRIPAGPGTGMPGPGRR